jgi:hypothetical protein
VNVAFAIEGVRSPPSMKWNPFVPADEPVEAARNTP